MRTSRTSFLAELEKKGSLVGTHDYKQPTKQLEYTVRRPNAEWQAFNFFHREYFCTLSSQNKLVEHSQRP
jgi:hypothetical protein